MASGLFSTYSTGENRVTASVLAVLRSLALPRTERLLGALLGDSEFLLVGFKNQPSKGGASVPDAEIAASTRVLVETKIARGKIGRAQIENHLAHLDAASESSRALLVLTPDAAAPDWLLKMDPRIAWASFLDLHSAIDELLADPREVTSEREQFLLRELQQMLEQEGLVGSEEDTVVVAARSGWDEYLKGSAYYCQPGRSFRQVQHIAFYRLNHIEPIVPRVLAHHSEVLLDPDQPTGELREAIESYLAMKPRCAGETRQVFLLSGPDDPRTLRLTAPLPNDAHSKSGHRVAFTQKQRYVASERLCSATSTSQLLAPV